MWYYLWPHTVYHLMRWFPRNNRIKARIVLIIATVALLVPQFVVLIRPHTTRYCGGHLLDVLVASIVFSFFMAGFVVLFSVMDPVLQCIKIAFHVFGIANMILLAVIAGLFFSQSADCLVSTQELYYYSLAMLVVAFTAAAFLLVSVPFWVANTVKENCVLDVKGRTGVCYEPVTCCQCVWHI